MADVDAQTSLPLESTQQAPTSAAEEPKKKRGRKPGSKNKKTSKKTSKKAGKKASKKTGKKAGKKTSKKRASKKKASKRRGKHAQTGCKAIVHVMPTSESQALWDDLPRHERRRRLIMLGTGTAILGIGLVWFLKSKPAKAAEKKDPSPEEETDEEETDEEETDEEETDEEETDEEETDEEETDEEEDPEIDVDIEIGKTPLPPPIKMGNIPPLYTRVYQIFDRFVEGGAEFFANLGDSESKHNVFAENPKGVPLSKAGVERQMADKDYGKEWSGKGNVPYTAYAEPDEAKQLGAMGLFQGVAGTIGQAGRRQGKSILAPMSVSDWWVPALQFAAFMEYFGALYSVFGAKTPEQMRVSWGLPSKGTKPNDPYYISRAAKWAERQKTTGVTASSFGKMVVRDHTVAEIVAYFSQFDYSPIVDAARSAPRMVVVNAPLSAAVLARANEEDPAFIGNDLEP